MRPLGVQVCYLSTFRLRVALPLTLGLLLTAACSDKSGLTADATSTAKGDTVGAVDTDAATLDAAPPDTPGADAQPADAAGAGDSAAPDGAPVDAEALSEATAPSDAAEILGANDVANQSDGDAAVAAETASDAQTEVAAETASEVSADVGASPTAAPSGAPCLSSGDCNGAAKVCDAAKHWCVACLTTADCAASNLCLNGACWAAPACKSDNDCKKTAQVCSKPDSGCVDCNVSADCGANQACVLHKCLDAAPCKSSKDCPGVCNTAKGSCAQCNDTSDCAEGKTCDSNGLCQPGLCKPGAAVCIGTTALACNGTGSGYLAKVCDDGNVCLTGAVCDKGMCLTGAAKVCTDGNPCTTDSCDPKLGCQTAASAGACDDGDACTTGDNCTSGKCSGTAKVCDDGNACTADSCQSGACLGLPKAATCSDGDSCTAGDACTGGKCAGTAVLCNDGKVCTADSCDAKLGCLFAASTLPCDDGDLCTSGDVCAAELCLGKAINCDDGNLCTDDSCAGQAGGCQHANNAAPCPAVGPCAACAADKCATLASGTVGWTQILGVKSAQDYARTVVQAANGEVVIGGSGNVGGLPQVWMARFKTDGTVVQEGKIAATSGAQLFAIAGIGAADVVVAGLISSGNNKGFAMRVNASGTAVWTSTLAVDNTTYYAVAVNADQSVAAAGQAVLPPTSVGYMSVLSALGMPTASPTFGQVGIVRGIAAVTGGYQLAGSKAGTSPVPAGWLAQVDATGAVKTSQSLLATGVQPIYAALGSNAVVWVGTISVGIDAYAWHAIKTDFTGKQAFDVLVTTDYTSLQVYGVTATPDGGVVLAGRVVTPLGKYDAWVSRLDSSGSKLWEKALDYSDYDEGMGVTMLADGGIAMSGRTHKNDSSEDMLVVRMAGNGAMTCQ